MVSLIWQFVSFLTGVMLSLILLQVTIDFIVTILVNTLKGVNKWLNQRD